MALLYSQVIQLCQNCGVQEHYNTRCPGAVVPGVETSEDCYNYISTSSSVEMVRFDKLGICWTYADGTCMDPPPSRWSSISTRMYNSWTARRSYATGNSTKHMSFVLLMLRSQKDCHQMILAIWKTPTMLRIARTLEKISPLFSSVVINRSGATTPTRRFYDTRTVPISWQKQLYDTSPHLRIVRCL